MSDEATAIAPPGKYLTFGLGSEEYALPVRRIREIIKMMAVTGVPRLPEYVKGVINLRGKIVPIIDLRVKLRLDAQATTDETCIIVVELGGMSERTMLGVVVDRVSEVLNIAAEEIEPSPDFGSARRADYVRGVAKVKGTVKLMLDPDRVLVADTPVEIAA